MNMKYVSVLPFLFHSSEFIYVHKQKGMIFILHFLSHFWNQNYDTIINYSESFYSYVIPWNNLYTNNN